MQALHGILLLARFRPEGFALFAGTPAAFMNSLAPLLGIAVVAGIRPLLAGSPRLLAMHVLTSVVALIGPAVVSHAIAKAWGREALWLRYAVAYNWCQLGVTLASILLMLVFVVTDGDLTTLFGSIAMVLFYWLGLCWFMLWRGLALSAGRATLGLIILNLVTGALVVMPRIMSLPIGVTGFAG